MPYNTRPTIRRRLLASKLRAAREAKKLSVEQAAKALGISLPTAYRQEQGTTGITPVHATMYANLYGVSEAERLRWEEFARRSKVRGWWTGYGRQVGPTAVDYAEAEDLASELRSWEPLVIPGLLQTAAYSEVIISTGAEPYTEASPTDSLLKLREKRKELLRRTEPPLRLWAILGEAAVLTKVGGDDVMREQVLYLLDLGERPGTTIQILPFDAGAHVGATGSFVLLSFAEDDIVFREAAKGGVFSEDPTDVVVERARYGLLQAQALSVDATRAYLLRLLSP